MNNYLLFCCIFGFLHCCNGYPIDPGAMVASSTVGLATLCVVFLVLSVIFLIGCACCRTNNHGFKQFRNSTGSLNQMGFTNRLASELSIFPPPGVVQEGSPPPGGGPRAVPSFTSLTTKPAAFSLIAPDVSDWFTDPGGNFPRQQLFYQRELGKGWFGKVVEGEAKGSKVVVRILREDATPQEKAHFLNEARPFRDLRHRNVASLHGKCIDHDPFLLLFDLCNNGDLKSFLVTNAGSKAVLNEQGICLRMMTDIGEGLNYMIENNFIHTDLAARNCLVASDLTVKIGDYGTGIDLYKDEYYITENVAIPIRWCAPETLHCTPTTIEAKPVTSAANVWSLAVVLWEIAEFGRLPYDNLTDDQVIIRVFGGEKLRLSQPDCSYGLFLYNIVQLCWRVTDRASLSQVLSMLHYLRSNPMQDSDFESRWSSMKPNTIPRVDNHTPMHSPRHTDLAQRPQLQAKIEFDSGVDLEMKATESCKSTTPLTLSPQLSVTSDEFFQAKKSASMTNLQGSFEDIHQLDSWLQGVEQKTEEDRKFVKNVSQAIKNLDEALALEQADSSQDEGSLDCKQPLIPEFRLGPLGAERKSDSSSDTEEETWRTRIERGEFTEKVKEKSKSVTDLMVLTHIDSEGSESDSLPSLTRQYSVKKTNKPAFTSIGFGSEGNIRNAVLSEDLQDKLKRLSLWKTEDQNFLGKAASETNKPVHKSLSLHPKNTFSLGKTPKSRLVQDTIAKTSVNTTIVNKKTDCSQAPSISTLESNPAEAFYSSEPPVCSMNMNPQDEVTDVNKTKENEVKSETELSSQDNVDNIIPEIKITETNLANCYVEPETDVDTQFLFNVAPRKFIIVCKEADQYEDDDTSETVSQNEVVNSNELAYDTICLKDETINYEKGESLGGSVGQCEDYSLEYFVGSKNTYVPPPDSCSEDDSEKLEPEAAEDSDFVNDDSQFSQTNDEIIKCCDIQIQDDEIINRTKIRHRDSMDDLYPDSLTASVTTISNSSGYATIEKDKVLKQDYNFVNSEDHQFSPAKDNCIKTDIVWDKNILPVKNKTELFLNSEKESSSLELIDGELHDDKEECRETGPKFLVDDVISQNAFNIGHSRYVTYFMDSGEGSSTHQDLEIKELKTRLEDAMKLNNDFHLKRTDEEYNGKIVTPDDERSSDSGFRDKGSLSESAEDTCDEKYNIEDIDAELDEFTPKNYEHYDGFNQEDYGKKRCEGMESWFLHQPPPCLPSQENGWLPESTEYEFRESVNLDLEYINAIRSELQNKLPQSSQHHPDDDEDEECSLDNENIDNLAQFNFPAPLSPIAEERESNQSSLIIDDISPVHALETPELKHNIFEDDASRTYIIDSSSKDSLGIEDQFALDSGSFNVDEDVLVVDTETNEATLIESPKPQSHLAFLPFTHLSSNVTEETCLTAPENYSINRDSVNFTPDLSVGSNSLSSPENGNLSGFFLSPCSVRSDLFDSGPPSLPFDIGQSLDEIEEIPVKSLESPKDSNEFTDDAHIEVPPAYSFSDPPTPILTDLEIEKDDLIHISEESVGYLSSECEGKEMKSTSNPICEKGSGIDLEVAIENSEKVQNALNNVTSLDSLKKLIEDTSSQLVDSEKIEVPINCNDLILSSELTEVAQSSGVSLPAAAEVTDKNELNYPSCEVQNIKTDKNTLPEISTLSKNSEVLEKLIESSISNNLAEEIPRNETLLPDLVTSPIHDSESLLKINSSPIEHIEKEVSMDHKKAEGDIDLLLLNQTKTNSLLDEDNEKKDSKNRWLEELLSVEGSSKQASSQNSALEKNGWPSVEELVVKPSSLNSTLALASPDKCSEYPRLPLTPCSPDGEPFGDSSKSPALLASPDEGWRPTIGQLLDLVDQMDGEEMTTSFIEPDENGAYTPDWESDTSESSSSGEFIWKDGDREDSIRPLLATPDIPSNQEGKMERIDEECEDESSSSDEGSCTSEFVPSTWDSSLTPAKPAIRSPNKDKSCEKKKVVFKKEKYQCIYEYPREASDDEEESSWQTPSSLFDYFDWELGESECSGPVENDSDPDETKSTKKDQDYDFYRLNYNSNSFDEGEFFSCSGEGSEFFPGELDIDSGDEFSPLAFDLTPVKEPSALGVLRHTKDQLKLDLKPVQPDRGEANILDSGIDTCSA